MFFSAQLRSEVFVLLKQNVVKHCLARGCHTVMIRFKNGNQRTFLIYFNTSHHCHIHMIVCYILTSSSSPIRVNLSGGCGELSQFSPHMKQQYFRIVLK